MNTVNIMDLQVGNIVHSNGARFLITSTKIVTGHKTMHEPVNEVEQTVMVANGKWIDGAIIAGYFGPNKDWTFQGNYRVTHSIEGS